MGFQPHELNPITKNKIGPQKCVHIRVTVCTVVGDNAITKFEQSVVIGLGFERDPVIGCIPPIYGLWRQPPGVVESVPELQ